MLDLNDIVKPKQTHTRESYERDSILAAVARIADELPRIGHTQEVDLADLGDMVDDDTLGAFDFDTVDENTYQNAKQNARNWSAHAVKQNIAGFADGKFKVDARKVLENNETVGVKFTLTGVRPKATDEV